MFYQLPTNTNTNMGNHLLQWKYSMAMFSMKITMCILHNIWMSTQTCFSFWGMTISQWSLIFQRMWKIQKMFKMINFVSWASLTQVHVPLQFTFCVKNKTKKNANYSLTSCNFITQNKTATLITSSIQRKPTRVAKKHDFQALCSKFQFFKIKILCLQRGENPCLTLHIKTLRQT